MDVTWLHKKINILAVDDDPDMLEMYKEDLEQYPPYTIHPASTIRHAEQIMNSGIKIYACLADLGMRSADNDEFYLIKKYHHNLPFIIVSGSCSVAKGALALKHGSCEAFDKPVNLSSTRIIGMINTAIIRYLFPVRNPTLENFIDMATQTLFNEKILSVSQWAHSCCFSEPHFRKLWQQSAGISPSKAFLIYEMLSATFDYYNTGIEKKRPQQKSAVQTMFYSEQECCLKKKDPMVKEIEEFFCEGAKYNSRKGKVSAF